MAESPAIELPVLRRREDPFAYACHGCGRCCHHKAIRVNPYEVARLADALGTTTTDVLDRHVMPDGATLRQQRSGACVFLKDGRCTVHAGRPLVCRLYPLGWVTGRGGAEAFVERAPHPETEGVYGGDGAVADYLASQGTAPYEHAAARYAAVHDRLAAAAERDGPDPAPPPPLTDVDRALAEAGEPAPDDVEDRVAVHLDLLRQWLGGVEASAD